jgi:release factor H-coupled RctB family protein
MDSRETFFGLDLESCCQIYLYIYYYFVLLSVFKFKNYSSRVAGRVVSFSQVFAAFPGEFMPVSIVTNSRNWLESGAVRQLEFIAGYPGVELAVGLPDLHGGRSPVGLAVVTRERLYPYLIGGDIGCGMALWQTELPVRKFKLDKFEKIFRSLEGLPTVDLSDLEAESSPIHDLGSLGGGNHFAEFQKVEEVLDETAFAALGLDRSRVALLVHTGSRGLGQRVLSAHNQETGYTVEAVEAIDYLAQHDLALSWAARNREASARRVLAALGAGGDPRLILDLPHNYLEKRGEVYIHRKGAVSTERGPAIIPGSRGAFTYLVKPNPLSAETAYSISHGAGRKWARSLCRERLSKKKGKNDLARTSLDSRVVCPDQELLWQEAPEAYKNIDEVINCLVEFQLLTITARMRPLLTYKN